MEHVLELKNISHSYHNTEGETPALKDLSFFLKKGEFISIVGPSGTIYNNVVLGLEIQHMLTARTRRKAHQLLEQYGLESFANARPSELSGGMRQRAALIRTLVLEPDLLLLDEPFSALDYQTRLTVGDDIGQIIKKEQKTAILVTHDLSEAISLGDRVIVLSERPATVQQTIPLSFSLEEDTPLHRRNAPEFKTYFNLIWKELNRNE